MVCHKSKLVRTPLKEEANVPLLLVWTKQKYVLPPDDGSNRRKCLLVFHCLHCAMPTKMLLLYITRIRVTCQVVSYLLLRFMLFQEGVLVPVLYLLLLIPFAEQSALQLRRQQQPCSHAALQPCSLAAQAPTTALQPGSHTALHFKHQQPCCHMTILLNHTRCMWSKSIIAQQAFADSLNKGMI